MKHSLFLVLTAAAVLSLCSCGTQQVDPGWQTLTSFLDFNNKTQFDDVGEMTGWELDKEAIVSAVSDSISSQTLDNEEYTLTLDQINGAYYLCCGDIKTSCRLTVQHKDGTPNRIRVFDESFDQQNLKSFAILSSSALDALFSNISSFDQGKTVLSGLYYGTREHESDSSSEGFSAVTRFEASDASLMLTISKISDSDLEMRHPSTTYNEPSTKPVQEQASQPEAVSKPAETNTARHDETTIKVCAHDIALSDIPTPSTAKFCSYSDMETKDLGNGHYQCTGWVDFENQYGAMLRYDFIVFYTATEKGYKEGSVEFFPRGS